MGDRHKALEISIHALREEGDAERRHQPPLSKISIHALREEGDHNRARLNHHILRFLSTPSARRATFAGRLFISAFVFLSTPSARRATREPAAGLREPAISIHALREEGDANVCHGKRRSYDFYPRPPRGGRHMSILST